MLRHRRAGRRDVLRFHLLGGGTMIMSNLLLFAIGIGCYSLGHYLLTRFAVQDALIRRLLKEYAESDGEAECLAELLEAAGLLADEGL